MKDKIALPAQSSCGAPPGPDKRLPYIEPTVTVLGDLAAITHAVGNTGRSDGGVNFGFMSSGV